MSPPRNDYTQWTHEQLIQRVAKLEAELRSKNETQYTTRSSRPPSQDLANHPLPNSTNPPHPNQRPSKPFDSTKYHTRRIALKLAYHGPSYNGFEHHPGNLTRLPTVEEALWAALAKTKLIFPTDAQPVSWAGVEYSKCGRTDRGVSAFGQVVALRVRSARRTDDASEAWDAVADELPYPRLLNRVLPSDIRVLAWCPVSEGFSARFSCRERRYRYYFTNPAYMPLPGSRGVQARREGRRERDGWLDVRAMREAAGRFVGLHDFRNVCKHDETKQTTNFVRRVFAATVEEAEGGQGMPGVLVERELRGVAPAQEPRVYYFSVRGSAFLWHQIRHMVAILFLVGQGLEKPEVVSDLLDLDKVPTKPLYEMADDAPLVLWDCIFPDEQGDPHTDALDWIWVDGQVAAGDRKQAFSSVGDGRYGPGGLNEVLWARWRKAKMDEVLTGALLDAVALPKPASTHSAASASFGNPLQESTKPHSTKVFEGGNGPRLKGKYVPILERPRMDSIEVQNERYAQRKGLSGASRMPLTPPTDDDETVPEHKPAVGLS